MEPIKIKEREIRSILIEDETFFTSYEKLDQWSDKYAVIYGLVDIEDTHYVGICTCCGHAFTADEIGDGDDDFECPFCDGENETILYTEIPDLVYSVLEDNCKVTILTWYGTEYNFDLQNFLAITRQA